MVALRKHFLDLTASLARQGYDGWSRAAEKDAEQVWVREPECRIQSRHKRLTRRLMETVGERFCQQRIVATLQRLQ